MFLAIFPLILLKTLQVGLSETERMILHPNLKQVSEKALAIATLIHKKAQAE